ncbi:MAG TPA: hypothetical protein VFN35_24500, partial [Ktedonobacteraceae bacterium]|nr:hypothetical protein [Ktedonobacteraceae bacterium]
LLRRLYETVAYRQSASIVGPRGIGKSSLLWHVSSGESQAQFAFDLQHHIFVFCDLREYLNKTSDVFFLSISKAIQTQCERTGLSLQVTSQGEDAFSDLLDEIADQGYFLVLLLDSFDQITLNKHFNSTFFEFLRAQASIGRVSYITASRAPLAEVCHSGIATSPFFNIFYTYALEAFTWDEAWSLITQPAQKAGRPFTEKEARDILRLAGLNPYLLQRVCYILYEYKHRPGYEEADEKLLGRLAYKELLPLFQQMWGELSARDHALLIDEAQQKGKQDRALPELSESALFRQFIRNTCQAGLFNMTYEELDQALDKFKDLKALGQTNLRLLKTVSRQTDGYAVPSDTERGQLIREVLMDAFENLKGTGVRSDEAPDWLYYNILYFRYFRHQLKNEQIQVRLGLTSIRQFYRKRNDALKTLLNELLDMENKVEARQ